jgi:hypothetical protein
MWYKNIILCDKFRRHILNNYKAMILEDLDYYNFKLLKIIEIAKIKNKNNYNISKQLIKHFK